LTFNQAGSQTISGTISGTGNLEKKGAGTLTLTETHTYTGTTIVAGGVLDVTGALAGGANHTGKIVLSNSGKIVFHQTGEQTFPSVLSGTGTVAFYTTESVVITSTGTLNPGATGTPGTLTFQNTSSVSFSAGARVVIDLVTLADDGSDLLVVSGGNLVLDGAQLVLQRGKTFPLWSPKGGSEIVIAHVENGGQIEGMFANVGVDAKTNKMTVADTAGRRLFVSVRANSDGGQDLLLTMFPEPSTYALLGGTSVLLLALDRRRQRTRQRTGNAGL
jgi:autotransporter-associated beta strand protein